MHDIIILICMCQNIDIQCVPFRSYPFPIMISTHPKHRSCMWIPPKVALNSLITESSVLSAPIFGAISIFLKGGYPASSYGFWTNGQSIVNQVHNVVPQARACIRSGPGIRWRWSVRKHQEDIFPYWRELYKFFLAIRSVSGKINSESFVRHKRRGFLAQVGWKFLTILSEWQPSWSLLWYSVTRWKNA